MKKFLSGFARNRELDPMDFWGKIGSVFFLIMIFVLGLYGNQPVSEILIEEGNLSHKTFRAVDINNVTHELPAHNAVWVTERSFQNGMNYQLIERKSRGGNIYYHLVKKEEK